MAAAERRTAIMMVIYRRGFETIPNLAHEMGVSYRTIMRDIELLSLIYPIYTRPGRYGGGVYIMEHVRSEKAVARLKEYEILQKIIHETERYSFCKLTDGEITALKHLLQYYSAWIVQIETSKMT